MVVCNCRKATKLYCYVHKVPVCGECICTQEHQICVVGTYSEWVIDGDYEWPPKCSSCQQILQDADQATCRLGCLHVLHVSCLEAHLKSFPAHTAPAGYGCPACGLPVWPPNFRDLGTGLPAELKEVISQAGLASTLLGNDMNSDHSLPPPPPAFSSMPLVSTVGVSSADQHPHSASGSAQNGSTTCEISPVEDPSTVSVPSTSPNPQAPQTPQLAKKSQLANSLARKNSYRPDKLVLGPMPYEDADEDAVRRKYARRGPVYKQILRYIIPFWSPSLPTLPVTTPSSRKDERTLDEDYVEGHPRRRHHRSSTVDPRNILFFFAILSCVATMMLLYYRLIQSAGMSSSQ